MTQYVELFEKVISENNVGEEFGDFVNVSDCLEEDGSIYVSFQSNAETITDGEIAKLMNEMEGYFVCHDFMPAESIISHVDEGVKVTVRMERIKLAEYDFSEAQAYLSGKVGGPDTMYHYCTDALTSLWEIHKHTNDLFDDKARMFDNVAATLKLCMNVFEKIKDKRDNENY